MLNICCDSKVAFAAFLNSCDSSTKSGAYFYKLGTKCGESYNNNQHLCEKTTKNKSKQFPFLTTFTGVVFIHLNHVSASSRSSPIR
mmetsp:Transcript_7896/g.11456  ORF Transcript_7896/g.11456 Transcript_7896/m.11456 type:complete len:86 (-) Transcript_7896:555-812(-)